MMSRIFKFSLHLELLRNNIRISHTIKFPCISDLLIKSSNAKIKNEKAKEADTNSEQTNSEIECRQNLNTDDMNNINISINNCGDGGNFDSFNKNTVYAADSDSDTKQEPKMTSTSSTMKELNAFFEKVLAQSFNRFVK